jgi:hypothetical protein
VLDEPDWLCLQCGTYYYTGLYQRSSSAGHQPMERRLPPLEKAGADLLASVPVAPHIYPKHMVVTLLQHSDVAVVMSQV